MKKLLYAFLFLFIGCSNIDESIQNEISEPQTIKKPKEDYTYTLGDVMVKWTAFKHSAKAQVGGQFKTAIVEGFTESKDLYSSISGVSFKIPVNSTSTNDTIEIIKLSIPFLIP